MSGFLDRVTPLLLTLDEMPNLERTLAALAWAQRIVVVDSGSADGTLELLRSDPRIAAFVRPFDNHPAQWNYALTETGIDSDWVLCLDADHVVSGPLRSELENLPHDPAIVGYEASFTYCIQGRPLRGSLYPPRIVLVRRDVARFVDDGHTQKLEVAGPVARFRSPILHDDRKPRSRWLKEQARYASREAEKLTSGAAEARSWPDRVRRFGFLAPWLVPLYCLLWKRGLLDGRAGWIYAGERAIAEWTLAIALFERRLRG